MLSAIFRDEGLNTSLNQKEVVEEMKVQWKTLWQERFDDKLRAEDAATDDYSRLFVDKGTVIHATRDFKALNFKEILEQHKIANAERFTRFLSLFNLNFAGD